VIIRLIGCESRELETARRGLAELARDWGHDLSTDDVPGQLDPRHDTDRAVDPVAVTALVLSIPSAALAVVDLADRIQKRRRAHDLIARARELTAENVRLQLVAEDGATELAELDPDRLLDLITRQGDPPRGD